MKTEIKNNDFLKIYNGWVRGIEQWAETGGLIVKPSQFIVCFNNDNMPIYAMMLFMPMNSNTAWIGFPIKNPQSTKEQRVNGLDFIIKQSIQYLTNNGFTMIYTTSDTPPVVQSLRVNGFKIGDENVNQYYYRWEQ